MKETKILILATNETFPTSEFTFWSDGKITHHQIESPYHAPYDSTTLYESGTWELVQEDIFIQPMTYERSLEIEELEMQVRDRAMAEFVYDDTYNPHHGAMRVDDFILKCHEGESDFDEDTMYDTKEYDLYYSVVQKYKEQIKEYGYTINDFDFEPYGFETAILIEQLMYNADYNKKYNDFKNGIRKELGLI